MRRTRKQFWRRTVSTLLALLLAMQALPAALAADAAEETEEIAAGTTPETTPEEEGTESGEPQEPADAPEDMPGNDPLDDPEDTPQESAEDGRPSSGTPNGSTGMEAEDGNGGTDGENASNEESPEDGGAAVIEEGWNQEAGTAIQWKLENGTLTLRGTGATGDYAKKTDLPWADDIASITAVVVEDGITALGKRLFIGATSLTSVSLPDTLTEIGEGTIRQCAALTEIKIPSSVTSLGRVSFYGCLKLETFVWENDPSKTYEIGDQVFSGDVALTALTLPVVTKVNLNGTKGPFTGCTAEAPLWTKEDAITFAGTMAQCKALFEGENAGVPASASFTVTCSDGSYTFGDPGAEEPDPGENHDPVNPNNPYTGYVGDDITWTYDPETKTLTLEGTGETYTYPSSIPPWYNKKGDESDFQVNLTNVVIGEGITKLGDRLFINAKKLTDVTFPSTLTEIAQKAFMNCTSLVALDMSAAPLEILGGNMFNGCSKLESVIFPSTLEALGGKSFEKTNLAEITYMGTIDQYKALADSGRADDLKNDTILVSCTDGNYIYGKNVIGELTYTVINGVMTLSGTGAVPAGAGWVREAYGVHTLVLRSGVTEVGENAFRDFGSLKEVYYVGDETAWEAFRDRVQAGNDPLLDAAVTLAVSGDCGEAAAWSLSEDETVLTISGSGPMADYRSAKEAPWRYSADAVTTLRVESGVTTLGDYAFQNFRNLTDVRLPASLERVGTYTFTGCYALTEIHIPEGVRIIAAKAFSDAKNLKAVYLPASLEAVDMKAFNYDTAIKDVYYAGTQRQWDRLCQVRLTNSGKGNANLLNAALHCTGTPAKASAVFDDVTGGEPYADALDYLVEDGYLTGSRFNGDGAADLDMALEVLYRRAGEPGPYSGAADWGKRAGLAAGIAGESLTAGELCLVLARTAAYNGRHALTGETAEEQTAAALTWAEAWLDGAAADAALTRGQAAVILAAYLQDSAAKADRHDQIIASVRAALEVGGDGRMYILAPDLTETTKAAKTGDCTLIVFPNGETMMIDSGVSNSEENVLRMVRELGLKDLDYFVLTHPHTDHAGNALAVGNALYGSGGSIGTYYYSGYPAPDGKKTESAIAEFMESKGVAMDREVHAGQQWTIGGVTVDVLGPTEEEVNSGNTADEFVNNVSILLKMTYGSSTYLTGGDLYISQEQVIIERLGDTLQADVMKANHHGLYTSNSWEWLEAVSPLVMVTENDDVGSSVMAEAAPDLGIAYYSAGVDGDVLIVMDDARQYEVVTQYDTDLRRDYRGEIGLPPLPDEPDEPDTPDTPDEPDTPDTPDTPDVPDTPDTPDTPDMPDRPDWPDDFDDDYRPVSPVKPGGTQKPQPEQPGQPEQPEQPEPETPAPVYTDVAEHQWFAPAVSFVTERNLMVGTAPGRFEPEGRMTRAMMATVLHRLAGTPAVSGAAGFADVTAERWFADAVSWAADSGVVTGVGGGRFDPDGLVTREQMAVMLYRMAAYLGLDTAVQGGLSGFSDSGEASSWAEAALAWAVGADILQGEDGRLMPQGTASRAEIAAVLMRFDALKK